MRICDTCGELKPNRSFTSPIHVDCKACAKEKRNNAFKIQCFKCSKLKSHAEFDADELMKKKEKSCRVCYPLLAKWVPEYSEEHKRFYYFHEDTKATEWSRPEVGDGVGGAAAAAIDE